MKRMKTVAAGKPTGDSITVYADWSKVSRGHSFVRAIRRGGRFEVRRNRQRDKALTIQE